VDSGAILNVSKTLKNSLLKGIKADSNAAKLVASEDQICFCAPKEPFSGCKLSIYLFNVEFEDSGKNQPLTPNAMGERSIQAALRLHYLVTPFGGSQENDQILLNAVIQTIFGAPVLALDPADANLQVTVKQEQLSLHDFCELWIALGAPLKPAVACVVSSVGFGMGGQPAVASVSVLGKAAQTQAPEPKVNLKLELYQKVFNTFVEQSEGWKRRNMIQRQWIQSDFKSVAGMTTEEMLVNLKSLGDSLQMGAQTDPFIDALKRLGEFYQHQLDSLKGFVKVQKKRQEGLDAIGVWIGDVKALIENLST
jgi:hypothetical protein